MNTPPYETVQQAEAVAPGVRLLKGWPRHVFNVYLVGDVLIDAGTRHAARRILSQLKGARVRRHVLTHAHMDHMGASHEVCSELGLPLLCGEADVAAVETGGRSGLADKPRLVRVRHRLLAGPGHPVSEVLREGDEVAGFQVLEVPGHSPGHLAFWREGDRTLILGDVLFNMRPSRLRPGLQLPPAGLTPDPITNLASARRLAALEPAVVCFGHGPPLHDVDRLQEFVEQARVAGEQSTPEPAHIG